MESISAAGCAHISPISPSIAFRINRAGMKMIPCLLKLDVGTVLMLNLLQSPLIWYVLMPPSA